MARLSLMTEKMCFITFLIVTAWVFVYFIENFQVSNEKNGAVVLFKKYKHNWFKPRQSERITKPHRNDRALIIKQVQDSLNKSLREERGWGCKIPRTDPFDKELMKSNSTQKKIVCDGFDWARCHLSKCYVRPEILKQYSDVECSFREVSFRTQEKSFLSPPVIIRDRAIYNLSAGDIVEVHCTGKIKTPYLRYFRGLNRKIRYSSVPSSWHGILQGFRPVASKMSHLTDDYINILVLCFESTSKNGFIRRMPKSFITLVNDINAVVLNNYNILGDGTNAAVFPILTGLTLLELPDRRRAFTNKFIDDFPFMFYDLQKKGYRTAFFEDAPEIGTFQYRYNGLQKEPTDHYNRHFFIRSPNFPSKKFCVGDTPSYQVMFNATEQFFQIDGKKYMFTFNVELTHCLFDIISAADDDLAEFLRNFKERGHLENTLLIVMGDHGVRFGEVRHILAGKLEERLPLMAIRLPDKLMRARPEAIHALRHNAEVLSSPLDIHATLVDALNMSDEIKTNCKAYSLLSLVPENRTCSEAGIERHWCSCLKLKPIKSKDKMFTKTGWALLNYINYLTQPLRSKCKLRNMQSIDYVLRYSVDELVLKFSDTKETGFLGKFDDDIKPESETFFTKITTNPGSGMFEATLLYWRKKDIFQVDLNAISRINAYSEEPKCISASQPHLNMFCYCQENLSRNHTANP